MLPLFTGPCLVEVASPGFFAWRTAGFEREGTGREEKEGMREGGERESKIQEGGGRGRRKKRKERERMGKETKWERL